MRGKILFYSEESHDRNLSMTRAECSVYLKHDIVAIKNQACHLDTFYQLINLFSVEKTKIHNFLGIKLEKWPNVLFSHANM